jgi:hypothetical protein
MKRTLALLVVLLIPTWFLGGCSVYTYGGYHEERVRYWDCGCDPWWPTEPRCVHPAKYRWVRYYY